MTVPSGDTARAFLLDIEGTTTPIEFVYEVLFPYARSRVEEFLREHGREKDVLADLEALRREHAADCAQGLDPPPWSDGAALSYFYWLMDRDRKSTALKSLQGRIWEEGYRRGQLRSRVYADVLGAFERWSAEGRDIAIFSSGSVLAQKLLFAHTDAGDLTRYVKAYFDTTIGAKKDPQSYRRIAGLLGRAPAEVLFVSDVVEELDAARLAGMRTALCVRPGRTRPASAGHAVIGSFDELLA